MDFAADAVFDVVAPPTRQAPTRAPSLADSSEPRFDDHLDAATADEAPRAKETAKADETDTELADTESKTDSDAPKAEAPVIVTQGAPPAPPPVTSPHIIQIVATATPEVEAAPVEATAPIEGAAPAAPTAPAPPPQNAAPAEEATDTNAAPVETATQTKSAAKVTTDTAPKADAAIRQNDAAPAQTPQAATPAQPVATQESEAPSPETVDVATTPLPAAPQPTQAAPQPKSAAKAQNARDGKAVEIETDTKTTPTTQATPQPSPTKANANGGEKNAAGFTRVTSEAPDIGVPAPHANAAAALAQPATHTPAAAAVDHTAATRTTPAASQVAREIIRRFDGENTRFELRLDPPELGRVEVRLEVSRDNRVNAVIAADSPSALSELSRHSRDLEAALQSAGLELGDNGLSFDLRQGSEGSDESAGSDSNARGAAASDDAQQAPPAARPLGYERWRGVRVDVMV